MALARLRGGPFTLRKQGVALLAAIDAVFAGRPIYLTLARIVTLGDDNLQSEVEGCTEPATATRRPSSVSGIVCDAGVMAFVAALTSM